MNFGGHEYAIETEWYLDEEGFEARQDLAQERLLPWIREQSLEGGFKL
jgi:hypothetical protein